MSVQCKKPPFTNTMFIDRSKFQEQFRKGSLKENMTNSFREDFFRNLFMFIKSSSPHSPDSCSDQNFTNDF